MIENTTMCIVKAFLKENSVKELTMVQVAAKLLENWVFAYENFDSTDQPSTFQSPPLLQLLSLIHLQDTLGWIDIPGLDLLLKCNHRVRGVLALCTAVV